MNYPTLQINISKTVATTLLFLSFLLLSTSGAFAHKISIVAWAEGNTIFTESVFGGGTTPKQAKIEVFNLDGKKLLDGTTNDNGEFQFKAPERISMKIKVDAGMGHQATCTLDKQEFADSDEEESTAEVSSSEEEFVSEEISNVMMNEKIIRKIVKTELNSQLNQMSRRLVRQLSEKQEPSITDILGGIGYIIGLVGLGMFINYRNKIKALSK